MHPGLDTKWPACVGTSSLYLDASCRHTLRGRYGYYTLLSVWPTMSNIYSSPTGPRLAGLHDKFFVGPPPSSSQPNDEDTDMPTYFSGSEKTEVATYVQEVHFF